jgi:hypothetical protein
MMQFADIGKGHAFARLFRRNDRQIVEAQNHVL